MLLWLAQWNNWIFLLALLVGVGMIVLTLLGIAKDADHDAEFSKDASDILGFLGVGRVPFSILIEVLLVSFGLSGLLVNAVANDVGLGVLLFPIALLTACASAVASTRAVASIITHYAPTEAATARQTGEFVGMSGTAATLISRSVGQVRIVPMSRGTTPAVILAHVDPEWKNSVIARGSDVLLVGYDHVRKMYRVRPFELP